MTGISPCVIQVPIGGIAVVRPPQIVSTLLGSCVGMIIQDMKHHIIALAHVVRPEGSGVGMGPGYFANLAAPRARDLAIQSGADPKQLIVRMAGGGAMGTNGEMGQRNAKAIKEATYKLGMVFGGHVAGPADGGCVLFADPATGRLQVRMLRGGALDDRQWDKMVRDVVDS
jgi:chemotaxis protein CheD